MPNMIRSLEGADYFFWKTISQTAIDNEWVSAIYTGMTKPILNPVIRTKFPEQHASKIIDQIKTFYTSRNVPWVWYVGKSKITPQLVHEFEEAGLHLIESAPRMAIELNSFKPFKNEIRVREVLNQEDFKDWSIPIRSGFGGKDDRFAELLSKIPCGPGKAIRHYIAYDQTVPVSGCTITLSQFGAKLDNMATSVHMQKKGFATALLSKALLDVKEAGSQFCFLDSSEDGLALYTKMGFQVLDELKIFALK